MSGPERVDLLVIGAGPAGQKAAIQGAKSGLGVVLVERERGAGGECVRRGTIPSKTLRESAVCLSGLAQRAAGIPAPGLATSPERTTVKSLMQRLETVLAGHERVMTEQIERNHVRLVQGRARFVSPTLVEVLSLDGSRRSLEARWIVVATGSRPRNPSEYAIDHEHVLDSDSILSMVYLPRSLVVLGAGVIAAEFATLFQALGVAVTMVDKGERPLSFLDAEITQRFVSRFESLGGRFVPRERAASVSRSAAEGLVVTALSGGEELRSEKVLVALGRAASVRGLGLENAGIELDQRGLVPVDDSCRTRVGHVYAVGDVIGPPALAAAAMEQGRRAVLHALGLPSPRGSDLIPVGIYTIPELASIGLSEETARERGGCLVGRAPYEELARGQINGAREGLLKLVADLAGERILGAQIVGEGATELVHLAQVAMLGELGVEAFVDNVFNFPTFAEAYRVAALDIAGQRARLRKVG